MVSDLLLRTPLRIPARRAGQGFACWLVKPDLVCLLFVSDVVIDNVKFQHKKCRQTRKTHTPQSQIEDATQSAPWRCWAHRDRSRRSEARRAGPRARRAAQSGFTTENEILHGSPHHVIKIVKNQQIGQPLQNTNGSSEKKNQEKYETEVTFTPE